MEKGSEEGDDLYNIVLGDLGLGETTRSSNYLNFELLKLGHHPSSMSINDSSLTKEGEELAGSPKLSSDPLVKDIVELEVKQTCFEHTCPTPANTSSSWFKSGLRATKSSNGAENMTGSLNNENFPTYADIPYGTSLRQQKKLYEQEMDSLRRQFASNQTGENLSAGGKFYRDSKRSSSFRLTGKEIEKKLIVALEEMEELKIELEACRKRLDAKYKAVSILKEQADLADTELKKTERRASETSKRLEQEVSKLQFELEWRESSFIDSQQTWAERFDRVCQENAILMSKLEARSEELRRANAHKSAIARERDELLALLDVTERLKYEQGKSRAAEEDYSTFTSSELAVLGACKCRVSSPEPCGCAHAAANLRKEVAKLREELDLNLQRREEANLTVDAYRSAFEEQLARSKTLSHRLSQIATMSSRTTKAKAAIKWLIQVLNDDEDLPQHPTEAGVEAEKVNNFSSMSLQELVTVLTEMLHEKNEALAHQKLAAQVLANKLLRFEKREGKLSETTDTGTNPPPHRYKKKRSKGSLVTVQVEKHNSYESGSIGDAFKLEEDEAVNYTRENSAFKCDTRFNDEEYENVFRDDNDGDDDDDDDIDESKVSGSGSASDDFEKFSKFGRPKQSQLANGESEEFPDMKVSVEDKENVTEDCALKPKDFDSVKEETCQKNQQDESQEQAESGHEQQ